MIKKLRIPYKAINLNNLKIMSTENVIYMCFNELRHCDEIYPYFVACEENYLI